MHKLVVLNYTLRRRNNCVCFKCDCQSDIMHGWLQQLSQNTVPITQRKGLKAAGTGDRARRISPTVPIVPQKEKVVFLPFQFRGPVCWGRQCPVPLSDTVGRALLAAAFPGRALHWGCALGVAGSCFSLECCAFPCSSCLSL